MQLLRVVPFSFGLVLAAVGVGNVWIGIEKVAQYEEIQRERAAHKPTARLAGRTQLDEAQSAALLRPLRQDGHATYGAAGKLAFYRVVQGGGWILLAAGLLTTAAGALVHVRRLRLNPESRSY